MSHNPRSSPQVRSPELLESACAHEHAAPDYHIAPAQRVNVCWRMPIRSLGSESLRDWAMQSLGGAHMRMPECHVLLRVGHDSATLLLRADGAERIVLATTPVAWVHDATLGLCHALCHWPDQGVRCELTTRAQDGRVIFVRHDAWRHLGVPGGRYERINDNT